MSYMLPVEMESIDNESIHEFKDEILSIPEMKAQKSQPIQELGEGSFSGGLQAKGDDKMWRNVVCRSIKTVVLSNKLNMLMPFGPLAIFVHIFTGHNGWVFFLTLLGITPLAERLGYATEQLAFYTGPTGVSRRENEPAFCKLKTRRCSEKCRAYIVERDLTELVRCCSWGVINKLIELGLEEGLE